MQKLLRLRLPENCAPIRATQLRDAVASVGSAVLPAVFHYGDDGRPLSHGAPRIRFVGGARWVGVLAMDGRDTLFDGVIGHVIQAATSIAGQPLGVTLESMQFSLWGSDTPQQYFLREMALKRRGPAARNTPLQVLAAERLASHLAKVGEAHGFDVPTNNQLGIVFHEVRESGIRRGGEIGNDRTENVALVSGIFSVHAVLNGMWQVGNLQSRGYGRIVSARAVEHARERSRNSEEVAA